MGDNTKLLMQIASILAQQNAAATAAAATVSNGSTGGSATNPMNSAMAELAKQLLINTASNLMPQMQASTAPSQQPLQQQQQQQRQSQSIPPQPSPHQQPASPSQSLRPPPPPPLPLPPSPPPQQQQQQQQQQLQNSQKTEPSLSHQSQLDNSEQKPLLQLQQQQQQQQQLHIASQQISQSSQIQSKQHQQHQSEHQQQQQQQTQIHHQHQQQQQTQIHHQQEQQPQQQTQIHHHQQQQSQHHQQQNQHHQQQQQNQHQQQQQQNQHHQQQQNQHPQQQNQQLQLQQQQQLQQQIEQLQQLQSSTQHLQHIQQSLHLSQQLLENSSLTPTSMPHSNPEAVNNTNVCLPQVPTTTCMSSPTFSVSSLNDIQFDGPPAKHAMGEKGPFSLPYMLHKRLRLPREKMKRGPKEKEFFRCFLFCLPDMYAKMPKFTSSDSLEQEIVRSYQTQGYGFPGQDYMGGVPRKTYLCLKQKEGRFLQYLTGIYPVLEGKRFELYRVDRQRNLIQLSNRTPRAIKDTKYQGTIIIIPFTRQPYLDADQPEKTAFNVNSEIRFGQRSTFVNGCTNSVKLNWNFDSRCSQGNSNSPPLEIVHTVGNASFTSTDDEQSYGEMSTSHMSLEEGVLTTDSSPYQKSFDESFHKNNSDFNQTDLFARLIDARNQLTSVRDIKMPSKLYLVDQLLPLYQYDDDICNCCLNLTSAEETEPGDNTASLLAKKMFCNFWKKILHKHFSGSFEKYPVVGPENGGDFFEVLGKILSHGLLLYGYWPVRFAKASACFVITEIQNEDSLLKSFINSLSEFEKGVVNTALKEARMLPPKFSVDLEGNLITVLGKYGILNVPAPCDLNDTLQRIAQTILIQRPYWALRQLADGSKKSTSCSFINEMSEYDVEHLYQSLVPEPSVLIPKLQFKHCDASEEASYFLEKKVREEFEMYLWSVSREQLEVIVECWGGCDCLIAPKYYVQFSQPEQGCGAVFDCRQCLLTLSKRLVKKTEIADALKKAIELSNND